ncbi:MAG: hypothetical protein ACREPG_09625, partial [Candidatus Binatia bacterium]
MLGTYFLILEQNDFKKVSRAKTPATQNPKFEARKKLRGPKQTRGQISLKLGKSKTPNLNQVCFEFCVFQSFEFVSDFGFDALFLRESSLYRFCNPNFNREFQICLARFLARIRNLATLSTQKFLTWYEWSVYGALCFSILLLGVGRVELGFWGQSMSAWSVSRTTLGFWVVLQLLRMIHQGLPKYRPAALSSLAPLASFFAVVTLSIFPDFRSSGDF